MHPASVDYAHPCDLSFRNAAAAKLRKKGVVNALNYLVDIGDNASEQLHIPCLQRFAHQGVVGIVEEPLCKLESPVKVHTLIEHQADEFGNADGWMSVVELYAVQVRNSLDTLQPVGVIGRDVETAFMPAQQVLHGGRGKEVLLAQTEFLALIGAVVGVEHTGDVLHIVLFTHRKCVILRIERIKIEFLDGLALPKPERAYRGGVIADYGHIIGDSQHLFIVEAYGDGLIVSAAAPWVALPLPIVRTLDLESINEALFEQAELIADAVTVQRQIMGCGAVKEARRKPAKAAVAESAVLYLLHHGYVHAPERKQSCDLVEKAQIIEIVIDHASGEIFGGNIIRPASAFTRAAASAPIVRNGVHRRIGERAVKLLCVGLGQIYLVVVAEDILRAADYAFCVH